MSITQTTHIKAAETVVKVYSYRGLKLKMATIYALKKYMYITASLKM
jgi:hypothetical protein